MAVSDYKTNPDENTTISGINIAEGCPPSGINNAIRQLMADVKQNSDDQSTEFSKVMTGATAYAAGKSGNVPAPKAGDQNKPLNGTGQWADFLDCMVTSIKNYDGSAIDAAALLNMLSNYLPLTGGELSGTLTMNTEAINLGSKERGPRVQLRCDGARYYILILPEGSDNWSDARPFMLTLNDGFIHTTSTPPTNNVGDVIPNTSWVRNAINYFSVTKMEFFSGSNSFSRTLPSGGTWYCIMIYNSGGASLARFLAGGSTWSETPHSGYYCFAFRTAI